jgi:hypothetical protein
LYQSYRCKRGRRSIFGGRYISVSAIVKSKSGLNVHTGSMGEKVHEEKQQIRGDYLYLRSIQGNNTDGHKSWPQMLKMNRHNNLEGM